jgi:hypothetical protein
VAPQARGDSTGGIDTQVAVGGVTLDGVILAGNRLGFSPGNCNEPSPPTPSNVTDGPNPNLESADTCRLDTSLAHGSLINTDAMLAPLADNGGPTQTEGLYPESPALDRVPSCAPVPLDQRGVTRPVGIGCDLGAFEGSVPRPPAAPPTSTAPAGSPAPVASGTAKKKKCKRKGKRRKCGRRH